MGPVDLIRPVLLLLPAAGISAIYIAIRKYRGAPDHAGAVLYFDLLCPIFPPCLRVVLRKKDRGAGFFPTTGRQMTEGYH